MKKTNKMYLLILSCFIFVFSLCFGFIIKNNNLEVKADSTQTNVGFTGSNIYVPVMRNNTDSVSHYDYFLICFSFTIDSTNNVFSVSFPNSTGFIVQNQYDYTGVNFNYNLITGIKDNGYFSQKPLFSYFNSSHTGISDYLYYGFNNGYQCHTRFAICGSEKPLDSEIISCTLGYTNTPFANYNVGSNYVKYTDKNGNYISFFLECDLNRLQERVYYFTDGVDYSDNFLYNQGYQEGLLDKQQGIYDSGYNAGVDIGYNNGYNAGVSAGGNYTFFSLISAIVDAPLKAFYGLFSFEIMGTNLASFIQALLTLSIVVFVLRFALQR